MTKILLIDDHPIVLQGCGRMLEDAGVTDVIEAADAAFGYRLFSGKRPEIVQLLSAARTAFNA
jgi:DNA-binding NarL/FixJ family response regulator